MIYASVFVIVYVGYASLALSQATLMRFVIGALFLSGPVAFIVSAARQVGVGTASLRHLQRVGLDLGGDIDPPHTRRSRKSAANGATSR